MKVFLFYCMFYCVAGTSLQKFEKSPNEVKQRGNYKLPIYPFHIAGEFPITSPQTTTRSPVEDTYENSNFGNGNYKWEYSTGDRAVSQQGFMINHDHDSMNAEQVVVGSYSYTAPDGQLIRISYISDANGYRPTGAILPVPPVLPPEYYEAVEQYNKVAASLGINKNPSPPDADISLELDPIKVPLYPQMPPSFIPIELPHALGHRRYKQ